MSTLIGKRLKGFLRAVRDRDAVLLVSGPLLAEFIDVASREKFRKHFPVALARELELILAGLGEMVAVEAGSLPAISRDPKDDYLLLMAKKGKADVLVTGDADLLSMQRYGTTRIMNAHDFTAEFLR
ncbi:MAG: putative toxin-antitoxin system toxin component, PIN family [Flavobacteriales bacterium]|nr:putative toxin-antitoxin system toxin component, PIN family [Flavobacteriales bacterium]